MPAVRGVSWAARLQNRTASNAAAIIGHKWMKCRSKMARKGWGVRSGREVEGGGGKQWKTAVGVRWAKGACGVRWMGSEGRIRSMRGKATVEMLNTPLMAGVLPSAQHR